MHIIRSFWFTEVENSHPIGIVEADVDGVERVYIGTGKGTDEAADAENIAKRGAEIRPDTAQALIVALADIQYRGVPTH